MSKYHTKCFACVTAAALAAMTPIGAAGDCPTTLSYLADRLPRYNNEGLERMRNAVLNTNVAEEMKRATAQGSTTAQAAAALLQAAQKVQSQQPNAEQCVRELSPNPERMMAELKNGTFRFRDNPQSALEACAAQYVLNYYMVIATKESAIVAACLARRSP
jgi:hypothetical protein